MQNKKRNAELHKNENARNHFTCNDTSIKNLGFLEFTDVEYETVQLENDSITLGMLENSKEYYKNGTFENAYLIVPVIIDEKGLIKYEDKSLSILEYINKIPAHEFQNITLGSSLELFFDKNLSFQDYISFKSTIENLNIEAIIENSFIKQNLSGFKNLKDRERSIFHSIKLIL